MVSGRSGREGNRERPALSGDLGADYEERVNSGGARPKPFATPSEVKKVFFQGITQLSDRLTSTVREHHVEATMARVRLHSQAIAKSHRHTTVFNKRKLQVAGVQHPGDILALVTKRALTGLEEFVEGATQNQLTQLSAVAEITPYNAPIEKGPLRSVVTLFDGTLDDDSSLLSRGLEDFESRGVQLKPYGELDGTYTTSSLPADESLLHMPWLRGIRPVMRFRTAERYGAHPLRPMSVTSVNHPLPLPIVGIVDSGIDTSIAGLQRLVVAKETHSPSGYAAQAHGSLVGALAATGGGFTHDSVFFPPPLARLVDIQVLGSGEHEEIGEDDIVEYVEDAVKRYGPRGTDPLDEPVRIWNLSIAQKNTAACEDRFSDVAMELDRIARQNKVIFTVAAGNYLNVPLRGWQPGSGPDSIANGDDRISPPADAALSISVGSLSDTSNPPTASPAEYPSPFSRRGPGAGMLVKPDVVHYGGTCDKNRESVQGIRGPHRNGTALEDAGTSFAAPRVAAQLAQLVGVLPDPEPELLKLLLLLSCTSPGDHDISDRDLVNYYGFGLPESPAAILTCNSWECTILLRGEIRPGITLDTPFPFPPSLTNQQKRRGFIRMGLVYTPNLDPSKGAEYCQTNVNASLGRLFDDTEGDSKRFQRDIHPLPKSPEINSPYEEDLIKHGWKWSPTKVYERTFSRLSVHRNELGWRLRVRLLLRRELEERREEVRQPFWLGIRISDPERRSPIYQEMRQQIQALAQPIALRPQTSVGLTPS